MQHVNVKNQLLQICNMTCLVKSNSGFYGYVNIRDYKKTWKSLYRAIREEYVLGNRCGIIYQHSMAIYFELNYDQEKELIHYKRRKKTKPNPVVTPIRKPKIAEQVPWDKLFVTPKKDYDLVGCKTNSNWEDEDTQPIIESNEQPFKNCA